MKYESLTHFQKDYVTCIFADECFNTSACDFDYEVNAHGSITGRTALVNDGKVTRCINSNVHVTMIAEMQLTQGQGQLANAASESMAREIAHNLFSEAHHYEHVNA